MYLCLEYGGKWKMLHYFAKKFFHATILSAFVDHGNVSLFYINDNSNRQSIEFDGHPLRHREFDGSEVRSRRVHSNEIRQFDRSWSPTQSHFSSVVEPRLSHFVYTEEDQLKQRQRLSFGNTDINHFKQATNTVRQLRRGHDHCIVMLQCFHWSSFEPTALLNITFPQVCLLNLLLLHIFWCRQHLFFEWSEWMLQNCYTNICLSFLLLCASRRHQSPEWMILSHIDCIQGEVVGFQVLLDSLHPRSTRVSWWSPPVLQEGSCQDLGICFVWHSRIGCIVCTETEK